MTYWFGSETILRFFKTGVFEASYGREAYANISQVAGNDSRPKAVHFFQPQWKSPFRGVSVRYLCPEAPNTIDWWGINYYSQPCLSSGFVMGSSKIGEPVFDNHFRLCPQVKTTV